MHFCLWLHLSAQVATRSAILLSCLIPSFLTILGNPQLPSWEKVGGVGTGRRSATVGGTTTGETTASHSLNETLILGMASIYGTVSTWHT